MPVPDIPPGFDFTDPEIYTTRVPAEELAELRRAAPVWWVTQRRGSAGFDDEGYWAVTRHADILAVSKTPDIFSSEENTALIRFKEGMPRESIDMQRIILLNMDPPHHTRMRGIVSRGFTPRAIGNLRQVLTERARRIVATALESGVGDFVADVASELPLQAISELIGVPQEDRGKMAVAGNETTRNAITHGMNAFFDHPEQWELYKESRPETAADEIVRWATPISVFQRTATRDTSLGGQDIKAGQRLGLFYRSANFDEEVFDEPGRFDIGRDPNPHLGYGGLGTHYCLGASLAKLEIQLIFNAIADAMPDITKAGDPARLRSGWINGIKSLPVTYRP